MKGIQWFGVVAILPWLPAISVCHGAGPSPELIEPGLRVGQIRIGESREAVERALGKPADQDAAMGGRLTEVWRSGPGLGSRANGRKEELAWPFTFSLPAPTRVQSEHLTSKGDLGDTSGEFSRL
jgi:hypothetical protein